MQTLMESAHIFFTSPRVPVRSWNRLHLATNAPSALFSRPPRQFQLFYWFPICRERESRSEISRAHYFGAARREIDGDELLEQLPIKSYWLMQQSPPPRNAPALRAIREIDGRGLVSATKNHTRLLEIDFDCIFSWFIFWRCVWLFIRMAFVTSLYNNGRVSFCGAQKKSHKPVTYDLRRQISRFPPPSSLSLEIGESSHKDPFSVRNGSVTTAAFFGPN